MRPSSGSRHNDASRGAINLLERIERTPTTISGRTSEEELNVELPD